MNISNGTILKNEYGSPEIGDMFLIAGTEVGRESSEWRKTLTAVEQTHGESALCAASLGFYWATQECDPTPGTSTQEHRKVWRAFVVETVAPVMQPRVHSPWAWWRRREWIWRLPRCLFNIHAICSSVCVCLHLPQCHPPLLGLSRLWKTHHSGSFQLRVCTKIRVSISNGLTPVGMNTRVPHWLLLLVST